MNTHSSTWDKIDRDLFTSPVPLFVMKRVIYEEVNFACYQIHTACKIFFVLTEVRHDHLS